MRRATPKAITNENTAKVAKQPAAVPNHLQNLKPKPIRATSNFKETVSKISFFFFISISYV